MGQYYKLGPRNTMFWDPGQPEAINQKLLVGEVKELKETEVVQAAARAGGLDKVSKSDYKELVEAKEKADAAANEAAAAQTAVDALATAKSLLTKAPTAEDFAKTMEEMRAATARAEELALEFRKKNAEIDARVAGENLTQTIQENADAAKQGNAPTADTQAAANQVAGAAQQTADVNKEAADKAAASGKATAKPAKPNE